MSDVMIDQRAENNSGQCFEDDGVSIIDGDTLTRSEAAFCLKLEVKHNVTHHKIVNNEIVCNCICSWFWG